jgi:nucleoside-diphosphate-sugar epimerase
MKVLVTGASGFIGARTCLVLTARGHHVRAAVRRTLPTVASPGIEHCLIGDIHANTDWRQAVHGVDAVLHLAGRAHVLQKQAAAAIEAFRQVNVHGTLGLHQAAQSAGVRRFVHVSSIAVLGQSTEGEPWNDTSAPNPVNAYGRSKWEAEQALASSPGSMQVVSIRPPMVYGPACPGNLHRLLRLVRSGVPLPLASAGGRRDMIGLDNLVDILALCLASPAVAGQTYVVCDGQPVSTSELIRVLSEKMGRTPRLLPVPERLLAGAAGLLGRADDVQRLFKPLRIDDGRFRQHTGWSPATSLDRGLEQTVRWFEQHLP